MTFDRHYHVMLRSDAHTQAWLSELGLAESFHGAQTRTGFYSGGRHHSMSNSYEFARFKPLNPLEKLRLAGTIAYASRLTDWRKLEGIPVADWLTRVSGRRVTEKIWLPLLRSKLGEGYRDTSAAFIWATIQRMNGARDAGLKREEFGHVQGGYGRVFDRLVGMLADLGVELRPGTPVGRVEAGDGGVRLTTAGGESSEYDSAVLTVPTPAVSKLVPSLTGAEHARLNAVRYQGIVCASVLLRKPLAGFYVTNITDAGLPFTAVIEMTALVPPSEFGGHTLAYLPKYADPADPIFAESDESVARSAADGVGSVSARYAVPTTPSVTPKQNTSARDSRRAGSGRLRVRRMRPSEDDSSHWFSADAPDATSAVPKTAWNRIASGHAGDAARRTPAPTVNRTRTEMRGFVRAT